MAYLFLCAILLTVYLRPADVWSSLEKVPFLYVLSGLLAVATVLSWMVRATRPRWVPHLTWILGVWFAFVFSHIAHGFLAMTLSTFTGFLTNVFLVFAATFVLVSPGRLRGFATLWILLSLFLAIDGIVQNATGAGFWGQPMVKGRIQGVGSFADPNDLCLTFLITVPLAHARFYAKGHGGRFLFALIAGVFTYATFLTNSRGGIVSLFLVFFALAAHRFGRKLGLVLGGILVLVFLAFGPSRVDEIGSTDASSQGRIGAWSEGLQMFKRNPVAGVGVGLFTDHFELTAHNSFVLCFAETGFLGAFFWLGLLYVSILSLRRVATVARSDPDGRETLAWLKGTQIAFLGFLAGAFFLSRTYNILLYLLIGFSAALYVEAMQRYPSVRFEMRGKDRWKVAGLVVGGIVLIYILVKTLAIWQGNFY
ncbi:MAG: O-antigen ligase family protein [Pseudomonadota bacterium]